MKKLFVVALFLHIIFIASSQTQTIRGSIIDKESNYPLAGANVVLFTDSVIINAVQTDENGNYELTNVSLGRQTIKVSYLGYKEVVLPNIIVSSGKEVLLNIPLEESVNELNEIVVQGFKPGDTRNEMSTVSTRQFSIEETDKYAGSRGDPARMASNFAGVQGADDSRNDIVIRGNSPAGVLWRLDGVDIFNPNHFNIPGTAGGPVSILNNKFLGNSDFFTGAFPAEFGNSIAGAFDLFTRNGNNQKHEFSGQFGFLGTELMAEGPLSKNHKSSYLFTYRYSTLALFSALGIDIGTDAVPHYQDGFMKLNFPMKNNANLSFYALGGLSSVDILISNQTKPIRNIYGQNDRDQYFKSKLGIVGTVLSKSYNEKTFTKLNLCWQHEEQLAHHELVYRHLNVAGNDSTFALDSLVPVMNYKFAESKFTVAWFVNHKLNQHIVLKAGINTDMYFFNFSDSLLNTDTSTLKYYQWQNRWNANETAVLFQPYIQFKFKINDALTLNAGLHSMLFTLSKSVSPLEPRIGLKYEFADRQNIAIAAGLHSQMQNTYLYFYHLNDSLNHSLSPANQNMDFTKSIHLVGSYSLWLSDNLQVISELYYQYLYQIPVDTFSSSFSLINSGASFSRFFPGTLQNTGTGMNYGIELTIQKYFANKYYFMISSSVFESKYKGSDGVLRNTDFNGHYAANFLGGKEFTFKNKNVFSIGGKITAAGGRWYGPVDTSESVHQADVIFVDSLRNTQQFASYFRADLKLNYRINAGKVTHEIGLDLVNLLNTKNILKLTYAPNEFDPSAGPIRYEYQLGFLPLFYYRIDF